MRIWCSARTVDLRRCLVKTPTNQVDARKSTAAFRAIKAQCRTNMKQLQHSNGKFNQLQLTENDDGLERAIEDG